MIKIKYHKFTDADLAKARKILGIDAGFHIEDRGEASKQINEWFADGKITKLGNEFNVDDAHARHLAKALLRGHPVAGTAGEDEIHLTNLGDEPSGLLGGALAHEIGHVKTHSERPDLTATSRASGTDMINELVAIYYSWHTSQNKYLLDKGLAGMRELYDLRAKQAPEMNGGMSFEEMCEEAEKIATKDLGAATPEQRAVKRQGKKRRNGGSGEPTQLKGVR